MNFHQKENCKRKRSCQQGKCTNALLFLAIIVIFSLAGDVVFAQWGDVVLPPATSPVTVQQRPYVQPQQATRPAAPNAPTVQPVIIAQNIANQAVIPQQGHDQGNVPAQNGSQPYQQSSQAPYSFYPSALPGVQSQQQQYQFRQSPQQQYQPLTQNQPMLNSSPPQQYVGQPGQYPVQYSGQYSGQSAQEVVRSQVAIDPNRGGYPGYVAAPAQLPYTGPDPGLAPGNHFGNQTTGVTSVDTVVGNHPLIPVLEWAKRERGRVAEIKDYTALLVKQENVNGKIQEASAMEVKIRQNPFSVYLKFREPKGNAGQEVIYVEGKNDGKMWAHAVGILGLVGTRSLEPTSSLAMSGNKYPITEIGLLHLVDQLIKTGSEDIRQNDGCTVKYYENAKVGPRVCSCIEVTHPTPSPKFRYYVARVYIDNELLVPIKYESYHWPKSSDAQPELIEAYIYHNLKFNVGLTDYDFDTKNKEYKF